MSTFLLLGFMALAGGKRVAAQIPGATYPRHYNHYVTSLKTLSDDETTFPAATLRVYSAAGDAPLPDNTLAYVIAKASAPVGQPVELDAFQLSVVPGNPNDENYDAQVPDCPTFAYGLGHLPAHHTPHVHDDNTKTFVLSMAEYVNGSLKNFAIECLVPATRRWANTPMPRPQSCSGFLGVCTGFGNSGHLQFSLEHITLSIGPHLLAQSTAVSSNPTADPAVATPKRRKYIALGSTSTPASNASPAPPKTTPSTPAKPTTASAQSSLTFPPVAGPSSAYETRYFFTLISSQF
ncbi:hypothetical protein R3P38DRAFT_2938741 [Favolaschia claudopus]|uniref:Uncharacterized protein n=2 Tax=Favolaschia claudopus TaxID=2862362 RepID=A0AAW0BPY8_9AGAR